MSKSAKVTIDYSGKAPEVVIIHAGNTFITGKWEFVDYNVPFWYLYWNSSPGGRVVTGSGEIELTPDKLLLIPPHTTFSTFKTTDFHHLYIHFNVEEYFGKVRRQVIELDAVPFLPLLQAEYTDSSRRGLRDQALIYAALLSIPQEIFLAENAVSMDVRIQKAVNLISKMTGNFPTVAELSRLCGMCERNFYQIFKQEIGVSPSHYMRNIRLEVSRRLLTVTTLPISEIAVQCGFANRYHYSKAFKILYGVSPAAFRRIGMISQENKN